MADIKIYHNPRCRKSREGKQFLDDRGVAYDVIEYLKTPPTEDELRDLLHKLGMNVREVMRKKEKIYKELNLNNPRLSEDDLIKAIAEHPILLERPIVVKGDRAVLARPAERIAEIL